MRYDETGVHFIQRTELTALTRDEEMAANLARTYIECLDLVRDGKAGTAERDEDGL